MDKKREELSLPGYMQAKGANRSSSALRAQKRAQSVKTPVAQAVPQQITLEEFVASSAPKLRTGQRRMRNDVQAKRTLPAGGEASASARPTARAPHKAVQGELRTGPVPVKKAGQKSTSSGRAAQTHSQGKKVAAANTAAKRQQSAAQPKRARSLDMTSSRIANQPRRADEKMQRKRGTGIHAGRLLLVLLVLSGIFSGVYALAKALPSVAGTTGDRVDVGATARLPKGVSILGIDVGGQTKSAARSAISEAADALLAMAEVTLKLGADTFTIKGSEMGLAYDIDAVLERAMVYDPAEAERAEVVDVTGSGAPGEFNNIFTCDAARLRKAIEEIAVKFDIAPVNAVGKPTLNADHTVTFTYEEGTAGRALDVEATAQKIEDILTKGIYSAQIDGVYNTLEPAVTGAMLAQEMGMRGSFTTRYPTIGATSKDTPVIENRVFNIHKAAEIINGCMVAPGEEWSFNAFVGPRTLATGWKEAKGIAYGKEYTMQAGGGICQVSTTLYNALCQAKVTVTDRRAHSIPSDYVKHGLDATVDYAMGLDLKFKNDTGAPLYLFAYFEDDPDGRHLEYLTFMVYGKPLENGVTYKMRSETIEEKPRKDVKYTEDETIPRGYKLVTIEARPSYVVEVYLDKYIGQALVDSEYLYTDRYAGNAEEARLGTGSPKYHEVPNGAVPVQ